MNATIEYSSARFRINRSLAVAVSLMVALMVLSACGSSKPKVAPQAAWSGTWAIKVNFGNATITVNKDETLVTKISYDFNCKSRSSATDSQGPNNGDPGWPIDKGGNFTIKNEPFYVSMDEPTKTMAGTISGRFASGGKSASGKWSLFSFDSRECSAQWTSTR